MLNIYTNLNIDFSKKNNYLIVYNNIEIKNKLIKLITKHFKNKIMYLNSNEDYFNLCNCVDTNFIVIINEIFNNVFLVDELVHSAKFNFISTTNDSIIKNNIRIRNNYIYDYLILKTNKKTDDCMCSYMLENLKQNEFVLVKKIGNFEQLNIINYVELAIYYKAVILIQRRVRRFIWRPKSRLVNKLLEEDIKEGNII